WWIIPLSLSTIVGGILVGFGRSSTMFVLTNIVEPLGRLAMLPVLWLLITNFEGTWRFILIPEVFGTVLIVVAGLAAVRLSGTAHFSIRNGWPEVPRIALVGLPLLAHGIAGLTFTYTDRLMVGAMLGDAQALG